LRPFRCGQCRHRVDPARLSAHVKTLASDAFEARSGHAGRAETVTYIIEQMKAVVSSPAVDLKGAKRAWTQDVPLAQFDSTALSISASPLVASAALSRKGKISPSALPRRISRRCRSKTSAGISRYGVTAPNASG